MTTQPTQDPKCDCELIEEVHGHQRCAGIKGGLKLRRTKAKGDK